MFILIWVASLLLFMFMKHYTSKRLQNVFIHFYCFNYIAFLDTHHN